MVDRFALRSRPSGTPILHQTWAKLLFLHWPVSIEQIRDRIPDRLSVDSWKGTAWVGLTPFTMWGVRPTFLPPIPLVSRSHELNVRTYVHLDGVPGVWFLSLDASNPLAVLGARVGFHLPYYRASMEFDERGPTLRFRSRRTHPGAPPARFRAAWRRGEEIGTPEPATRDFFLIERYCLYAERHARLYRARIFHRAWPLCHATLTELSSTMLESHGIATPDALPLLHQQREPFDVEIWPLEEV